ncbi:MAG: hypothetical protein P0S95_06605 [Rhabdochlamydiaceae bacterium]|nr:hypothetical protein [Candidatus Amphrikana amoebophyrae]
MQITVAPSHSNYYLIAIRFVKTNPITQLFINILRSAKSAGVSLRGRVSPFKTYIGVAATLFLVYMCFKLTYFLCDKFDRYLREKDRQMLVAIRGLIEKLQDAVTIFEDNNIEPQAVRVFSDKMRLLLNSIAKLERVNSHSWQYIREPLMQLNTEVDNLLTQFNSLANIATRVLTARYELNNMREQSLQPLLRIQAAFASCIQSDHTRLKPVTAGAA